MRKKYSPAYKSLGINLVLFFIFFGFLHPIYNSGEDFHISYLLGGGFGQAPTEMAHYNHIVHPFLGWLIKNLFLLNPNFNWYTLFLVIPHFIFGTLILEYIIRKRNNLIAFAAYAVLFIGFEGYFLLLLDFTGSSIALTCAGLLFLLIKSRDGIIRYRDYIWSGLLLILASFYRIHAMIPILGIALPFLLFASSKKTGIKLAGFLLACGLSIFLLNLVHQSYYKSQKTDWPQEEAYRHSLFRFFNESGSLKNPKPGEKWYAEYEMIHTGIIIDTNYLPSLRLDSMYASMKKQKPLSLEISNEWLKWFFINNRLFFCIILLFICLYGIQKLNRYPLIISLLALTGGLLYLIARAKLPPFIMLSGLSFISFAIFLQGKEYFFTHKKTYNLIAWAGILLLGAWAIIRLPRFSKQNENETNIFKQEYKETSSHPDKLFILAGGFHLNKFYAFDTPSKYPFDNILYSEHFIENIHQPTLSRFGINSTKEITSSPNVYFWGPQTDEIKEYLEKIAGKPLLFSKPLPEFKRGSVWKILTPVATTEN